MMPTHEERRWISLSKGAMPEIDPVDSAKRISLANGAIKQRLATLDPCNENHRLKRDLANASRNLRVLALSAN
jgi:hypothetical protein